MALQQADVIFYAGRQAALIASFKSEPRTRRRGYTVELRVDVRHGKYFGTVFRV